MNLDRSSFRVLRNASDLHTLVVSRASLPLVKLAYEIEPKALTDEVLQDAFCRGARPEVLRFLLDETKTSHDSGKVSEMIAKAFLEAIPQLVDTTTTSGKEQLALLHELIQGFPSALINSDVFYHNERVYYCAMNVVIFSECFPEEILEAMICSISNIPNAKKTFRLLDNPILRRLGSLDYRHGMRTELNDKGMEAIAKLLTKVEKFTSYRDNSTEKEFSTLLPLLVRSSNTIKQVHLDFDASLFHGGLFAPAKKQLEDGGVCPITEFSVQLCGGRGERSCDSSFLNLLSSMKSLTLVNICLWCTWSADSELCTRLCDLLPLETLVVEAPAKEAGLFMPLLDAANNSSTCKYFAVEGLKNPNETKEYQGQMLTFLESNTRLAMASICDGTDLCEYYFDTVRMLKGHMSLDWSTDEKSSIEQRKIDYCTLLNQCGRGKARDTKNTSRKDIVVLLNVESIQQRLDYLEFQDEKESQKQDFISNLQYGLLREAPTIWVPKEEQDSRGKGARQISGKRKASHLLESYL